MEKTEKPLKGTVKSLSTETPPTPYLKREWKLAIRAISWRLDYTDVVYKLDANQLR